METSQGIQHGSRQMLGVGAATHVSREGVWTTGGLRHLRRAVLSSPFPPLSSVSARPVPAPLMAALSPQRDLDFTIDLDFKGQLCELSCSTDYRMR